MIQGPFIGPQANFFYLRFFLFSWSPISKNRGSRKGWYCFHHIALNQISWDNAQTLTLRLSDGLTLTHKKWTIACDMIFILVFNKEFSIQFWGTKFGLKLKLSVSTFPSQVNHQMLLDSFLITIAKIICLSVYYALVSWP